MRFGASEGIEMPLYNYECRRHGEFTEFGTLKRLRKAHCLPDLRKARATQRVRRLSRDGPETQQGNWRKRKKRA